MPANIGRQPDHLDVHGPRRRQGCHWMRSALVSTDVLCFFRARPSDGVSEAKRSDWRCFECPMRVTSCAECVPHVFCCRPMMLLTYLLIVGPSVYYFAVTFPKATLWEQGLALTLLPGLFLAFTMTACADPGIARMEAKAMSGYSLDSESADDALAGVSSYGLDFSSSGVDADALVDEDTAAQRRALHHGASTLPRLPKIADLSASYGFRQTLHEQELVTGKGSTTDTAAAMRRRQQQLREESLRDLQPGDALPLHHPDMPEHTEYCDDCDVVVEHMDHHCPWTGQCIAKKNTSAFYWFLALVFAALIFVMVSSFAHGIKHTRMPLLPGGALRAARRTPMPLPGTTAAGAAPAAGGKTASNANQVPPASVWDEAAPELVQGAVPGTPEPQGAGATTSGAAGAVPAGDGPAEA